MKMKMKRLWGYYEHRKGFAIIIGISIIIFAKVFRYIKRKKANIKFWIINLVGNLILLVPLVTIVPLIYKKYRNIKSIVLLCFSVSIIIEFLQYISMYFGNRRSVDIDDVILNTLGALIGFAIFKLINSKVLKNV